MQSGNRDLLYSGTVSHLRPHAFLLQLSQDFYDPPRLYDFVTTTQLGFLRLRPDATTMPTPNHIRSVPSPTPPSRSPAFDETNAEPSQVDIEKAPATIEAKPTLGVDIEHVEVVNDPRKWSRTKKVSNQLILR